MLLSNATFTLSRMTDNGKDGFVECRRMQNIVDGLGSDTRILVASLRDAETLADLAVDGLDTFTFSPAAAISVNGSSKNILATAGLKVNVSNPSLSLIHI